MSEGLCIHHVMCDYRLNDPMECKRCLFLYKKDCAALRQDLRRMTTSRDNILEVFKYWVPSVVQREIAWSAVDDGKRVESHLAIERALDCDFGEVLPKLESRLPDENWRQA